MLDKVELSDDATTSKFLAKNLLIENILRYVNSARRDIKTFVAFMMRIVSNKHTLLTEKKACGCCMAEGEANKHTQKKLAWTNWI